MKRLLAKHSPLVLLAGLCIAVAVLTPDFRTANNLENVAYRTAVVGVVAAGQTVVILTAGIDLSVGSVAALTGVVGCLSIKALVLKGVPFPVPLGIGVGVLIGLLCGLVNGLLITKGKIPPFIVTLGMMMVARGATVLLSNGIAVSGLPDSFLYLGGGKAWWIPVAITVAVTAFFSIMLAATRFGRALYAIGGNLSAARLSGIPVDKVRTMAYLFCGLLSGLAGMMLASRTSIASPNAAEGYELEAIAACVIGGASLMGGEGACVGSLAGALIMYVLVNFCNLMGFNNEWQKVLVGTLTVALVYYDNMRKRKAGLLKEQ